MNATESSGFASDRAAVLQGHADGPVPVHRGSAGDRRDRSWRRFCSTVHKFNEPIEKRPLALENFHVRNWQIKPFGAVDLGKGLHLPTLRRPGHPLAPTLTDIAQRFKRTRESGTSLFQEFAAGSDLGMFVIINLALRNRPGSVVLVAPVRSARMYQQDLQLAA